MNISSGAKKDLLVLSFIHSILTVSMSEDTKSDDDILKRNGDYRINKQIDRNINRLQERIKSTIDELMTPGIALWIKSNMDKRIGTTLSKIQEEYVSLELMAIWIAFANFCERDKPLDDRFKWLTNEEQYFRINEIMQKTNSARLEDKMFNLAYEIISMIKG